MIKGWSGILLTNNRNWRFDFTKKSYQKQKIWIRLYI